MIDTELPARLVPLLAQFDHARERLRDRIAGLDRDSGNGRRIASTPMNDAEYLWEPAPGCWSVRRKSEGPGPAATALVGAGTYGRDAITGAPPEPPPITTIAFRLSHLSELLALRAEYTAGDRLLTRDGYPVAGTAADAIAGFALAAEAWRAALLTIDDAALDTVGYCTYPYGSDTEELFSDIVWWVNQELLHHGAEIALLRDLYRVQVG